LGTKSLVPLNTESEFRVSTKVLEEALAASNAPTILVLDAGDLNVGAFDPFSLLIPIARAAKAWVHVDGAFGLWARASTRLRDRLAGVELADSWATDAHKWLNTPKDIGIAIVNNQSAHRAAMGVAASYMAQAEDARDQIDWTPEWTRRARGFPVYAALRELGREGVADMIDRCCAHAVAIADGIGALEGADLVARPALNQGLIRFRDPRPSANEADHDRYTEATVAAINEDGTAFFSMGAWQGRRVMRISVVNWRTSDDDVRRTVEAVARVLARRRAA
jgi:aromatic-L-amino-acid decarboxylase